jgi:hypothetical protein
MNKTTERYIPSFFYHPFSSLGEKGCKGMITLLFIMKYIITMIRKILPKKVPKPVGRWRVEQCNKQLISTPLNIYNGTPKGVPLEIQGQQLPINELNGTPQRGRVPFQILIGEKIDLSNEDHCGPCGQYALSKTSALKSGSAAQHPAKALPPK